MGAVSALRARAPVLIPAVIVLAGGIWGLDRGSMWQDEATTAVIAARPLPELWHTLGRVDAVHGAYYLLIHGLLFLFGGVVPLEVLIRIPSLLAAAAAAAGVSAVARATWSPAAGLFSGSVFALLPAVSRYAQEGRSYALVAAALVWSTYFLVRGRYVGYAIALAVGCLLNLFAVFVLLAHGTALLLRRVGAASLRRWAVAALAGVAPAAPVAWIAAGQTNQVSWLTRPGWPEVRALLGGWAGGAVPLALLAALAVLCAAGPLSSRVSRTPRPPGGLPGAEPAPSRTERLPTTGPAEVRGRAMSEAQGAAPPKVRGTAPSEVRDGTPERDLGADPPASPPHPDGSRGEAPWQSPGAQPPVSPPRREGSSGEAPWRDPGAQPPVSPAHPDGSRGEAPWQSPGAQPPVSPAHPDGSRGEAPWRAGGQTPVTLLALAVPFAVLPPAALLAVSQFHPLYQDRYVLYSVAGLAWLAGAGLGALAALASLRRTAAVAAATILVVTLGVLTFPAQSDGRRVDSRSDDPAAAARVVADGSRDGDAVLFLPSVRRLVREAYPDRFSGVRDAALAHSGAESGTLAGREMAPEEVAASLRRADRVWVVSRSYPSPADLSAPTDRAKREELREHYRQARVTRVLGYAVRLYVRKA